MRKADRSVILKKRLVCKKMKTNWHPHQGMDHVTCDITCLQKNHEAWTFCRHNLYKAQWKKTSNLAFYGDCTLCVCFINF